MSITTLNVSGKEYVLLPRKQYDRLALLEEDRRDAAAAKKALARLRAGKSKSIPLSVLKKKLGL